MKANTTTEKKHMSEQTFTAYN